MSIVSQPNQLTTSLHTSSSQSSAMPSTQAHQQVAASSTASIPLSSAHNSDSDDDLSDAPESPIDPGHLPTSFTSSNLPCHAPPPDSDSDLSDAPDSPTWPESPKSRTPPRIPPARCTEQDCPVREAKRRHYQGQYLHNGNPPNTSETLFGTSNPPPHVWNSWMRVLERSPSCTVEDDWNVLGFLRWHVNDPDTCFMGSWVSEVRKPSRRA